jgi:hypothetical protein
MKMWLLRIAIVGAAILCFLIGPLAAYKGFQVMRSGNVGHPGLAIRALVCGIALVLFGIFLLYTLFTF